MAERGAAPYFYGRTPTRGLMSRVIHLQTEIPGPKSRALLARRARAVPEGVPAVTPIAVAHAEGSVLTDADGNRLIDFGGGIGVVNTGHRHPARGAGGARAARPLRPRLLPRLHLRALRRAGRADEPDHPGHPREADVLRQQRRGGGRERGQGRARASPDARRSSASSTDSTAAPISRWDSPSKVMPYKKGFGPFAPELYRIPYPYCYRCGGKAGDGSSRLLPCRPVAARGTLAGSSIPARSRR